MVLPIRRRFLECRLQVPADRTLYHLRHQDCRPDHHPCKVVMVALPISILVISGVLSHLQASLRLGTVLLPRPHQVSPLVMGAEKGIKISVFAKSSSAVVHWMIWLSG